MSVRNVAITHFPGGASRPSRRRFHSCTRRPQRHASRSLIFRRRRASTVSVTIACIRLRFLYCSDSKSILNTSSWVYPFSIMSVRNVAITHFPGGASRPSRRRFHSCTRRPQRRLWCLVPQVVPAPGPVTPALLLPPLGGIPNSSLLDGNLNFSALLHLILHPIKKTLYDRVPGLKTEDLCKPSRILSLSVLSWPQSG